MKCGRVQLQEREKCSKSSCRPQTSKRPVRMCQKRLVDPEHDEDPRWFHVLQRVYCNTTEDIQYTKDSDKCQSQGDLFLSVQNLRFQGDEKQRKRPRTGFKYKTVTNRNTHRMFVKQVVANVEPDEDTSSQLTGYYYDDYAKYLSAVDRSRPSSGKSSVFFQGVVSKYKANKSVQVDLTKPDAKKTQKVELKNLISETKNNFESIDNIPEISTEGTKVSFLKCGKRRSLTISRIPSPETVQVIRVDVVCNYDNNSSLSGYEDKYKHSVATEDKKTETANIMKNPHFANKYLLTNSIKTLDENVSGGAKVTLLCKTFRLADRLRVPPNKNTFSIAKPNA